MKKVVMTVLVGLGFCGLQGYHVSKFISNFLSESDKEKYINAEKQVKFIGDDMNYKCTNMCIEDDKGKEKFNNDIDHRDTSNHCVWDTKNTCICRAKYNDGHYHTTGKTFPMTNGDYAKYSSIISSVYKKCDSECYKGGFGDPGHNIYDPNANTCACRKN